MGPIVQWQAFGSIIRTVAIGAILGGGFLGLFKMAPTFIGIFGDITQAFSGEQGEEYVEGKGWYEWPLPHPHFHGYLARGNHCHLRHRGTLCCLL